ncbi:conjugative transfer signal peptidase TraF [uncultured Roseobacter sp.]|uniref:conjugative transfer signal peptidase TraF n=1 Tax=uncultured Roseobacter sp. TaxID=114847 RepID=UPI00262B8C23|nr:conjugative transfer signal peptidase TraF [uncultured Roseobacter sp.]
MDRTFDHAIAGPRHATGSDKQAVKHLLGGFVLLVVAMLAAYAGGVRYNGSPSYPMGFYLLKTLDRTPELGALVFACPPDTEAFREARRRHYIGQGTCPAGYTPIIKKVAAKPGDIVDVGSAVSVNSVVQRNTDIAATDVQGRTLQRYQGGVIAPNHYLLLSDFYEGSFDSRYFGPLHRRQIIGNAQPVLTW